MQVPTIMMVTYNRLDLTKKTFKTTLTNTGCYYNLIIVDNGSTDGTMDWLMNFPHGDKCLNNITVFLENNYGIAYGRSYCLKLYDETYKKDTSILCTLDNDVVLPDNWLKDCEDILLNGKNILACGVNLEDVVYPKVKIKASDDKVIQIKSRGNLGTACACFKPEVFEKIGYFDDIETYAHEDAAYFLRMRLAFKNKIVCYLENNGEHIGIGKSDEGEYREMKNKFWKKNMRVYNQKANDYMKGISNLYVGFKEKQ